MNEALFAPVDLGLAQVLARRFRESSPDARLAAALASAAVRYGHLALKLGDAQVLVDQLRGEQYPLPPPMVVGDLRAAVAASPFVKGDASPLVLEGDLLYLRRYHEHELALAAALRSRMAKPARPVDEAWLEARCTELFDAGSDIQRRAARAVLERDFVIVTGGPGTGKTHTAVRLVALLLAQAKSEGRTVDVQMLAPTGKASARLVESVTREADNLKLDKAIVDSIPRAASTIHRALGVVPGSVTRARHHAQSPMRADVVLVDEASMIDASLFRRLVEALRPNAKLVLLGDPDQLASVDAGAVFGDLVRSGRGSQHVFTLETVHRYAAESSIGRLARAIRDEDVAGALGILRSAPGIEWIEFDPKKRATFLDPFDRVVTDGYAPLLEAKTVDKAVGVLDEFRVLAAHRMGPYGVSTLDKRIAELLDTGDERVVLVTHNDYDLGLFNGDLGVVRKTAAGLMATFGERAIGVSRLPPHESAFAMTIHKSQGSEVRHVAVVLPDESALLGRELLYTAVTRASERVTLFATRGAIEAAIRRPTSRLSGVGARTFG